MKHKFNKIRRFIRHNRFIIAVAAAIFISALLAILSVAIYVRDGALLLDLSRPSYAPVRQKIKKSTATSSFSSTGEVDAAVVKDFRSQLKKQAGEINKLGTFDAAAINDSALQLQP